MQVLYEDRRMIVCRKPAGVLSTDEKGGMPEKIRQYLGDANACVKTVHRLDAAVSGVMVFARSHKAAAILSEQIRNGTFKKEYLAVVSGLPLQEEGVLEDYLQYDRAARMSRVCPCDVPGAQRAVLHYRVLEQKGGLSLLAIRLQTGRTHQIRVQLSSRGFAILGDRKYGAGAVDFPMALACCRLSFLHPQTQQPVSFCCNTPTLSPWNRFETRCLP